MCELWGGDRRKRESVLFPGGTWDPGWGLPEESKPGEARTARRISPAALYTMQYIVSSPMTKLYSFTVTEEVLWELERHIQPYVAAEYG